MMSLQLVTLSRVGSACKVMMQTQFLVIIISDSRYLVQMQDVQPLVGGGGAAGPADAT